MAIDFSKLLGPEAANRFERLQNKQQEYSAKDKERFLADFLYYYKNSFSVKEYADQLFKKNELGCYDDVFMVVMLPELIERIKKSFDKKFIKLEETPERLELEKKSGWPRSRCYQCTKCSTRSTIKEGEPIKCNGCSNREEAPKPLPDNDPIKVMLEKAEEGCDCCCYDCCDHNN